MKRVLCWLFLAAFMMTGCGVAETASAKAEGAADAEALAADAAAVYNAISETQNFTVTVEEPDGALTALHVTPDNAWNVENRAWGLEYDFAWRTATERDWTGQLESEERGNLLTLVSANGRTAFYCCSGGDVVFWRQGDEETYARAVNPLEGQPFEGKVYDDMAVIAKDAIGILVWSGTVDGSLPPEAAAERMAEQVAEEYRNVPAWVGWKPADAAAGETAVYDVYLGTPEQFCFDMDLLVWLEEPALTDSYWNAGAGVQNQEADGGWHKSAHVRMQKNEAGDWAYAGGGDGVYLVDLPFDRDGDAPLEELLNAFFLTEGDTHQWRLPYYILSRPAGELAELPALLEGRTEQELLDFGAALTACCRQYGGAGGDGEPGASYPEEWASQEDLRTALGPYAVYLDA